MSPRETKTQIEPLRRLAAAVDAYVTLRHATNWRRCTEYAPYEPDTGYSAMPCFEKPDDEMQTPSAQWCHACQRRHDLWPAWNAARRELRNARKAALRIGRGLIRRHDA
jgi:hypothetical protein